jgi:D-alanyl-D-alanine carboxypeptidase
MRGFMPILKVKMFSAFLAAIMFVCLSSAGPASANFTPSKYSSLVVDSSSGRVLSEANADVLRHPASLTKMMTLYMLFEAIKSGDLDLSDRLTISYFAASRPPTRLGVIAGGSITIEEAILALITRSANDVAAAVGERLGNGSEQRFAQMMTFRARSLGMTRTTFRNASGLPDPDQYTTARDMVLLGRRLLSDFPVFYRYFSTEQFTFRGRTIGNHNHLLQNYAGVDGIKTGYVDASGFNIVVSVVRGGSRLVAAVFGGRSWHARDRHMVGLLDAGFSEMGLGQNQPNLSRNFPAVIPRSLASSAQARMHQRRRLAPAERGSSFTKHKIGKPEKPGISAPANRRHTDGPRRRA